MSSQFPTDHDQHRPETGTSGLKQDLKQDLKQANQDLAGHVKSVRDDVLDGHHHGVKHHLRNSQSSAQDALSHAREALQKVTASAAAGSQPIADDLKNVLNELDQALHAMKHDSRAQVAHLREALQEYYGRIHQIAKGSAIHVRDTATRSVEATQQRVVNDPLKAVGVAAGVGVLIGLWLGHCARRD